MPYFPPPGTLEVIHLPDEHKAPPGAAWVAIDRGRLITNMATPEGRMPLSGDYGNEIDAEDKAVAFAKERREPVLYVIEFDARRCD
jgi:hypothetical protein